MLKSTPSGSAFSVLSKSGYFAAAAVLLAASTASAGDQSAVLTYQSAYFADARPNTAMDMINRLPGFEFNDGSSTRGFAGSGGNVLIDGQRPTAKTDDVQSILTRMPASNVDHIDIIRGGAPGIDMQGQTVIANVIRKTEDSTQIVADIEDNFWPDGHTVPNGSIGITTHTGQSTYEATLTRYGNFDDSVGKGSYNVTDLTTDSTTHYAAHTTGAGSGGAFNGAMTVPLFDGQFKANLTLQDQPFRSGNFYAFPGNPADNQTFIDLQPAENGELGLHWNGNIGDTQLEVLGLQRMGWASTVNTQTVPGDDEFFYSTQHTGESIVRATLRYAPIENLTLEGGAEGAYNFLTGDSLYLVNGVNTPLPSADAQINEKRAEAFAQGTWKINPQWMLELGSRAEYSVITETGDVNLSRSFFYPKPRAVLTWTPDSDWQVRLRYEKVVGQLDFNDFIATSSLAQSGVTAGNPNLKPDQHTQYEISAERHFWDKGAIVATLMHEQIQDVIDYVPVTGSGGVFDAPGNIGSGQNTQLDVEVTLPLDKVGLPNGLLQGSNIIRFAQVHDPVTDQLRTISGQRPQVFQWSLTQDVTSLKSTWQVFFFNCWDEYYYRIEQVRHRRVIPPYIGAYWEYKPTSNWSFHVELDNADPFVYDDKYWNYPEPRNESMPDQIQELRITSQPRLFIDIRKTFN
jgi:Outer membrane protein beta-barrel family